MLLVGPREEPFLQACLESLASAIDLLIVNDNSPARGLNRETLEQSALARTGRRWRQYGELGDAVSGRQADRVQETLDGDARRVQSLWSAGFRHVGRELMRCERRLEAR